jgi:hypothetical protein
VAFLRAIRENALTIWPEAAYRDQVMVRQFLGRKNFLLNAPDAIHHVLVDNPRNYRRTPASIRILRPITGERPAAEHRRRLAAATAHRRTRVGTQSAPVIVPSHHGVDGRGIGYAGPKSTARLLTFMQSLALDIAGRSMFSLETRQYGAAMRRLLTSSGNVSPGRICSTCCCRPPFRRCATGGAPGSASAGCI